MDEQVERLKEVRKALGLKQTEMAELLGMSMDNLSMIERGKRKLLGKHLLKLETTEANVDYIRTGEGAPLKDARRERIMKKIDSLSEDQRKIVEDMLTLMVKQNEGG